MFSARIVRGPCPAGLSQDSIQADSRASNATCQTQTMLARSVFPTRRCRRQNAVVSPNRQDRQLVLKLAVRAAALGRAVLAVPTHGTLLRECLARPDRSHLTR